MGIPNIITFSRVFLTFIFSAFLLNKNYLAAIIVFIIAGLSDVIDGYLARKLNQVSELGKLLDPFVDKFMQLVVLITIGYSGLVKGIKEVILIYIFIEFAMLLGSAVLLKRGVVVEAEWFGKIASLFFYVAVIVSIIEPRFGQAFLYFSVILQFMSFVLYYKNYSNKQGV